MAKDADKNQPTTPSSPKSAEGLPAERRDTNVADQGLVIDWKTDPFVLCSPAEQNKKFSSPSK